MGFLSEILKLKINIDFSTLTFIQIFIWKWIFPIILMIPILFICNRYINEKVLGRKYKFVNRLLTMSNTLIFFTYLITFEVIQNI